MLFIDGMLVDSVFNLVSHTDGANDEVSTVKLMKSSIFSYEQAWHRTNKLAMYTASSSINWSWEDVLKVIIEAVRMKLVSLKVKQSSQITKSAELWQIKINRVNSDEELINDWKKYMGSGCWKSLHLWKCEECGKGNPQNHKVGFLLCDMGVAAFWEMKWIGKKEM
ncbi:hypothetical protein Tco_1528895 [Tanacetum coccineum]